MNFVYFVKAFNSVHYEPIESPFYLVEIIRSFFSKVACYVGDGDNPFEVKAGVRQDCAMSTMLFNLVVH